MKVGLDYFRSRKYAYFLTFFSVNNADAEIMLLRNLHSVRDARRLSAFAGIYYRLWLPGCELIHKSPLEKYRVGGGIFLQLMSVSCRFLKAYCCLVRIKNIYSFKCAAFNVKHLRGRTVKHFYVLQGVLGSILSDVNFFSFLFSRFSLIPSQSASLYIIASFEVYLIAENI